MPSPTLGGEALASQPPWRQSASGSQPDTQARRRRRGRVETQRRSFRGDHALRFVDVPDGALLPVLVEHDGKLRLIDEDTAVMPGDLVDFVVATERRELAEAWLAAGSWGEADTPAGAVDARLAPLMATRTA